MDQVESKNTPGYELQVRLDKLQTYMAAADVDGALIVENTDLFYFSGALQHSCLFVPREGSPLYFVRRNPERARSDSPLETIIPVKSFQEIPQIMADHGIGRIRKLGMELDVLPVNHYFRWRQTLNPNEIVDIWPAIQKVRMIKSPYETGIIRTAAKLADFMVATARAHLRVGIREVELAAIVEGEARKRGHQGLVRTRGFNQEVYWGHLLSGPEAASLTFVDSPTGGMGLSSASPQGSGFRKIGRLEPVIMDLVGAVDGYIVDQTRTFFIGYPPKILARAYEAAIEIEDALAAAIRPGVPAGDLFRKAQQMAADFDLAEHFMGYGTKRAEFCGHGIGLELDEAPVIATAEETPLAAGMVLALEPKFSFPDLGVVGVEDTFLVTDTGVEKLTGASYECLIEFLPRDRCKPDPSMTVEKW
ncbi:MAG: Xaa-Pro peptidase family protein [Syntrophales bacterium]|nr:Xaa-Pro peptidase family protein [Syntrophales bacterium]